jgi:aminopeptidase YwaD
VFYNPDEHKKIIAILEEKKPAAIISATGRNAALAGGVYPFPLIEDGDFDIPSVYITEEEGGRLAAYIGKPVVFKSSSRRIPGVGYNVVARKGRNPSRRIVISAHIDAKKGTPGAIDNASGVVVLLLLAELLKNYNEDRLIEIVAFNGEDYYAVPGQMLYVSQNQDRFHEILLNINIDGAGYKEGKSAFSLFNLPLHLKDKVDTILNVYDGITEGVQWVQGDHSIFIQNGRPAIAVSSVWFTENIDTQDITHTPKDDIDIVDCSRLVEITMVLDRFLRGLTPRRTLSAKYLINGHKSD